jgi:hypothetical protein
MHVEFLVEEPSMEAALQQLLPRILPVETTYRVLTFQDKKDLLDQLPVRLRGYAAWMTDDYRIVVLVDQDRQDCLVLKGQLERAAEQVGLLTKTRAGRGRFQVLNRIAIEELEAWFLGDVEAICRAYPRVSATLPRREKFRNPDAVPGGTWEALAEVLQKNGYFKGGYSKLQAAREISVYMDPARNRSKSFQVFRDGLLALT